jgi:ankyrin repeat protein
VNREDAQVVEFLLRNGADPNLDDLNITRFVPQSMLMVACKRGNLRVVRHLLKYGAYINLPSDVSLFI